MHTKPLKHAKNMQILTNYIKKHDVFKISYKCLKIEKPFKIEIFSYFPCTFEWMFPNFLKIQNLLKACCWVVFAIFTYPLFAIL